MEAFSDGTQPIDGGILIVHDKFEERHNLPDECVKIEEKASSGLC